MSRVTGMLRDMLMAFCYGTDPAIAAFLVAFRLASLLRRVFGEGALTVGFIPHFESIQKESVERAAGFFRDLVVAMSAILIAIVALSEVGLFGLSAWMGFSPDNQQIVHLTAIMLPGLLFICLFSLFSALLQCYRVYFLPGLAPVAFNLVWIAAAWTFRNQLPTDAAKGLALAITIAFFFQWLVLVPRALAILRPAGINRWRLPLQSPDLRALATSLSLGVIGVGAMQVNSALDALFARYASLEGPAYLNFAIRIQQVPLALFAIAIAAAVLPAISRASAAGDKTRYRDLLQFALARAFSLVFPCTVALLVLGGPAINLVFGRGQFTQESVVHTTSCLVGYGIGLVPASFVLLMASAFYSRKDYWTPTRASLLAIGVNLGLNTLLIFGFGWGAQSVAISTSIAAYFNLWFLHREFRGIFSRSLLCALGKVCFCSCIAGLAAFMVGYGLGEPFPRDLQQQVLHFVVPSSAFCLVLMATAWLTDTQDLLQLIRNR